MQVINQSLPHQHSKPNSTVSRDSKENQPTVYTLENLIQALEEVANYLTGK